MSCAVCGANARRGGPPIPELGSLTGKEACDWCARHLEPLAAGQLQRSGMDELVKLVVAHGKQDLADELESLWRDPAAVVAEKEELQAADTADFVAQMAALKLTTGPSFEGSRIVQYLNVYTADRFVLLARTGSAAIGSPDLLLRMRILPQEAHFTLADAKAGAFAALQTAVVAAGGNAIIGIALSYAPYTNDFLVVTASGTAVIIEPCEASSTLMGIVDAVTPGAGTAVLFSSDV